MLLEAGLSGWCVLKTMNIGSSWFNLDIVSWDMWYTNRTVLFIDNIQL